MSDSPTRLFEEAKRQIAASGEKGLMLMTQLRPLVDAIADAVLALDRRIAGFEDELAAPEASLFEEDAE